MPQKHKTDIFIMRGPEDQVKNKRHYSTNVQPIGMCGGEKRLIVQLHRNGYIKIFKMNCNTGNNCLPTGMEVANPNATPQMK